MKKSATIAMLVLLTAMPLAASEPETSSEEELQTAAAAARLLEEQPLSRDAKQIRSQLTQWLVVVPDVTVTICGEFFPELLESKKNYAPELFMQSAFSQAAFAIENPEHADSAVDKFLAGVEGTLRAYEAIRREKPKTKWRVLDDLIKRREEGTLRDFVADAASRCE